MTVEELVPDGLWAEIAPLLPPPPPRPKGGRQSKELELTGVEDAELILIEVPVQVRPIGVWVS